MSIFPMDLGFCMPLDAKLAQQGWSLSNRGWDMLAYMNTVRAIAACRKLARITRGWVVSALIRAGGGTVGNRLEVEAGTTIRWGGHKGVTIGSDVRFGRGVVIDAPAGGRLIIGDRVKIMHQTIVAASQELSIGDDTQIAEHCSIRDSDHGMNTGTPIGKQQVSSPTRIGSDVWIGRGSAVLRGADIGDGAVIGANSVARSSIASGSISVGCPAVHKKFRDGFGVSRPNNRASDA